MFAFFAQLAGIDEHEPVKSEVLYHPCGKTPVALIYGLDKDDINLGHKKLLDGIYGGFQHRCTLIVDCIADNNGICVFAHLGSLLGRVDSATVVEN